jgi:tRNA U34 5-carboxymethylaminomethyl modifying GTPase MnmE/TrmE
MAKKTLFGKAKPAKKNEVVSLDTAPVVYDFEAEKEGCIEALVKLVGEQQAAEGLHFIKTQCENDPDFVMLIFDRKKRNQIVGLLGNMNPADMLGNMFSKFF